MPPKFKLTQKAPGHQRYTRNIPTVRCSVQLSHLSPASVFQPVFPVTEKKCLETVPSASFACHD